MYLALNMVFIFGMPLETMKGELAVGALAASRLFGGEVAGVFGALMALAIVSTVNAMITIGPRVYYAMAKDGLALKALTRVHPRHATPTLAIWSQAIWAAGLVIVLKKFDDLTNYVVFASLLFYALTVLAVYRLRRSSG